MNIHVDANKISLLNLEEFVLTNISKPPILTVWYNGSVDIQSKELLQRQQQSSSFAPTPLPENEVNTATALLSRGERSVDLLQNNGVTATSVVPVNEEFRPETDNDLSKYLSSTITKLEQDLAGYIYSNGTIARVFEIDGQRIECVYEVTYKVRPYRYKIHCKRVEEPIGLTDGDNGKTAGLQAADNADFVWSPILKRFVLNNAQYSSAE